MSTTHATDAIVPATFATAGQQAVDKLTSTDTNLDGKRVPLVSTLVNDTPTPVAADVTVQATNAVLGTVADAGTVSTIMGRLTKIAAAITANIMQVGVTAGTAIIGKVGIDQTTPDSTAAVTVRDGKITPLLQAAYPVTTQAHIPIATALGTAIPANTRTIVIQPVGAGCNVAVAGANATAAFGDYIPDGQPFSYTITPLSNLDIWPLAATMSLRLTCYQ